MFPIAVAAAGVLLLGLYPPALADTRTELFTGSFASDNDVHWFSIQLNQPAALTVYSTSGANGGFPTNLTLFAADGTVMQQQSGSPACSSGRASPNADNLCNDAYLQEPPPVSGQYIPPGSYIVAVTQSGNVANGDLTYGFTQSGTANQNYTNASNACGSGTSYFCDPFRPAPRTGAWSLTFSFATAAGITPSYVVRDEGSNTSPGTNTGTPPVLGITTTHSGNFTQGQQGATYSIVVSNDPSAAAANQTITVTDSLPTGLTLVSMAGTGWDVRGEHLLARRHAEPRRHLSADHGDGECCDQRAECGDESGERHGRGAEYGAGERRDNDCSGECRHTHGG